MPEQSMKSGFPHWHGSIHTLAADLAAVLMQA